MSRFAILHLSDLQAGHPATSWWAAGGGSSYVGTFHEQLAAEIAKVAVELPSTGSQHFFVNLVLLTGDIAERGLESQYGSIFQFLQKLQQELQRRFTTPPELLLLPGNHDVDWGKSGIDGTRRPSDYGSAAHFADKFAGYNSLLKRFGEEPITKERPYVIRRLFAPDKEKGDPPKIIVVGFNSCLKESDRYEDHYGVIDPFQRDAVMKEIKNDMTPTGLLVAAFHHNPLLYTRGTSEVPSQLIKTAANGDSIVQSLKSAAAEGKIPVAKANFAETWLKDLKSLSAAIRNHLEQADDCLEELKSLGFSLALHGHQHFDDAVTLYYPKKGNDPYDRPSITVLGTGSTGLRTGSRDNLSTAHARLLLFEKIPWGWRCQTQRIEISGKGEVAKSAWIQCVPGPKYEVVLPVTEPLEPVRSIDECFKKGPAKCFLGGDKDDKFEFIDDPPEGIAQFVLWRARTRGAEVGRLAIGNRRIVNAGPKGRELYNLSRLHLRGLARWAEGGNYYANQPCLTVEALRVGGDNVPQVALSVGTFSRTVLFNWSLPKLLLIKKGKPASFRSLHVLPHLKAAGERFFERFPYLSHRCEVTVVATVKSGAGLSIVATRRSNAVGAAPGDAALFVGGGCRPSSDLVVDNGEVRDTWSVLRNAALAEMRFETGYSSENYANFHLLALYLDPHYLTPVWLFWLDLDTAGWDSYESRLDSGETGRDRFEHLGIRLVPLVNPRDAKATYEAILKETRDERDGTKKRRMTADSTLGLRVWTELYTTNRDFIAPPGDSDE